MHLAIYDRNSFQRFLSLDIVGENVPEETTILNFRHGLETHRLTEAIFAEIGTHLAQKGLTMKTGEGTQIYTGSFKNRRCSTAC